MAEDVVVQHLEILDPVRHAREIGVYRDRHHARGRLAVEVEPVELVTASGSGLDPHLPPQAVAYQIPRVAAARKVPEERLQALLEEATLHPLIGPPVVNVLALNQALETLGH